jgi:hypothetical protein
MVLRSGSMPAASQSARLSSALLVIESVLA